jgi:hypothetical protein
MADKQIQPVRNRDYQITQRTRPRGLWGQVWMVVLQPGYFFRTLPLLEATRSWLWAAVLILALTGISAVRQAALLSGDANAGAPPVDFGAPPDTSGGDFGGGIAVSPAGGFSVAPIDGGGGGGGEFPLDGGVPPDIPTTGSSTDITTTWTTALLAGAAMVFGWFLLTVMLSEVTLFNGRAPSLGQNFQVAIWASVPFALMAALQLVFFAAGGQAGEAGMSGLLSDWVGYSALPHFWQSIILSLASRLTLFWLWSLILIYVGARHALHGKRWASALVVVIWAIFLVIVPVVTGAVKAPEQTQIEMLDGSDLPALPDNIEEIFGNAGVDITNMGEGQSFEVIPHDGSLIEVTAEPGVNTDVRPTRESQQEEPAVSEGAEQPSGSKPIIIKPVPGG